MHVQYNNNNVAIRIIGMMFSQEHWQSGEKGFIVDFIGAVIIELIGCAFTFR